MVDPGRNLIEDSGVVPASSKRSQSEFKSTATTIARGCWESVDEGAILGRIAALGAELSFRFSLGWPTLAPELRFRALVPGESPVTQGF